MTVLIPSLFSAIEDEMKL